MKQEDFFKARQQDSYLGESADYLESLYETYLESPAELPADWQQIFQEVAGKQPTDIAHAEIRAQFLALAQSNRRASSGSSDLVSVEKIKQQARLTELVNAHRRYGHRRAKIDPLGLMVLPEIKQLTLAEYGFTDADLDEYFHTTFSGLPNEAKLRDILAAVQETYCGSIGFEFLHINCVEEMLWLQQQYESKRGQPNLSATEKQYLLNKLTSAEGLEKYLALKYVGQKRFGLEGGESFIPLMDELVKLSSAQGVKEVVIGMAHRGRLNVLVNILGKSPGELFAEFEGKKFDSVRSGDVKYHKGFSSDIKTEHGVVHLALAFNPSHLEIVGPVVEGSVRARQERRLDHAHEQVLPIVVHGDAAFAGQGVNMETFNLSLTEGFGTGGTIHLVINNQIGYTTSKPLESRSTPYCTDVAKIVEAPVFHVNGDDPEAVLFVTRLAFAYRAQFKKDVVIDLVCYRRHGHNEGDEPSATQPIMYQVIKKKPTTRTLYAERLVQAGVVTAADVKAMADDYQSKLDKGEPLFPVITSGFDKQFIVDWTLYNSTEWQEPVKTALSATVFTDLAKRLNQLPANFVLQPQVAKLMQSREKMAEASQPLDWGFAELMAYASLVQDGYSVRLVGQDCQRGTFAHRHAVLHHYENGETYSPIMAMNTKQAKFNVINSTLSEEAVLAFEYGFATADPKTLVIWEAQFGDFFNGAQVVIDQFISSGEQKWGRLAGLTLFLPHGFEGQGPEHSSARLERFLQLCAQLNMQVCVPSTPAQCFHMLRRQMLRAFRTPLIVMTPKSLLRHRLAVSELDTITKGKFQLVIPEVDALKPNQVRKVVLCAGKVFYDLYEARANKKDNSVAIIRVEQLYPFPHAELKAELEQYTKAKTVVWCQEEPMNQGSWYCIQHWLKEALADGQTLSYAGRDPFAAPAVGSAQVHKEQQEKLVEQALS